MLISLYIICIHDEDGPFTSYVNMDDHREVPQTMRRHGAQPQSHVLTNGRPRESRRWSNQSSPKVQESILSKRTGVLL